LEGFGDIEGVIREESELYLYLQKHQGKAYVNADDPILMNMARRLSKVVTYSTKHEADVVGKMLQSTPTIEMQIANTKIRSSLTGAYNGENILSAAAIAMDLGLSLAQVQKGVDAYLPSNNRSQYVETARNHVIMDAYNANPTSMVKALESFDQIDSKKKLLLLGDMLEMGEKAAEEHRHIADLALAMKNTSVIFVGREFKELAKSLDILAYRQIDELLKDYPLSSIEKHWVLVKGSRGVKMEKVLEYL